MKEKEIFSIYNNLIRDQFVYGGQKYAGKVQESKKEATDELCEDFGLNGLFWTLGKYCQRYKNVQRERDILKLGCYCYIIWLKRGFFVQDSGLIDVLNTNVSIKEKNFGTFIDKMSLKISLDDFISTVGQDYRFQETIDVVYNQFKKWANKAWIDLKESDIKLVYHLVYSEWKDKYKDAEKRDTDTYHKDDKPRASVSKRKT